MLYSLGKYCLHKWELLGTRFSAHKLRLFEHYIVNSLLTNVRLLSNHIYWKSKKFIPLLLSDHLFFSSTGQHKQDPVSSFKCLCILFCPKVPNPWVWLTWSQVSRQYRRMPLGSKSIPHDKVRHNPWLSITYLLPHSPDPRSFLFYDLPTLGK